jgi:hypothetical protein
MGRRGRKAILYEQSRGSTAARESLERRWQDRCTEDVRLAALVTSDAARYEPYHRWFHFRQGFAPELVRRFLDDIGLPQQHGRRARGAVRIPPIHGRRDASPGGTNPKSKGILQPLLTHAPGIATERMGRADVPVEGGPGLKSCQDRDSGERFDEFGSGNNVGSPRQISEEHPPVLDPFSGSGTTVMECARRGVSAVGIEAEESLAFVVNSAFAEEFPPLPDMADVRSWKTAAAILTDPLHRTALLCAVARLHSAAGRPNRGAPPFADAFAESVQRIREDLKAPLPVLNRVYAGDARNMSMIGSESIRAILTSPPYLSRYDYSRMLRPLDELYRAWFPLPADDGLGRQLPAAAVRGRRLHESGCENPLPEAVVEAAHALEVTGHSRVAALVRRYFLDMFDVLRECGRVLNPGGTCRVVIGGARLHDVYIPTDLILAELAESIAFQVESLVVARRLIPSGRKLGRIHNVSPREAVLTLTLR